MAAVLESGEISASSVYTLAEFQRRSGLKRDAMRAARHRGLKVIRAHGRVFVSGREWIDYLGRMSQHASDASGG